MHYIHERKENEESEEHFITQSQKKDFDFFLTFLLLRHFLILWGGYDFP